MAVLIGIDEAGYGPIMGPLVVSAAAFELPDELLTSPLWEVLKRSVARNTRGYQGRILINDSKKLHLGQGDYLRLQRGVLACLAAISQTNPPSVPTTVGSLLTALKCPKLEGLADYPWYHNTLKDWPLYFATDDIITAAAGLSADLWKNDVRLLAVWSIPLLVGRFNELVAAADNKATVLFSVASQLIHRAYQNFDRKNLQIVIDKHGGRNYYRPHLQRLYPDLKLKILKEGDQTSSYHLTGKDTDMKVHFLAKGDDRQLPIALASMTSKYVRELFMEVLNAYFQKHCPEISPTAGYYKDGRRFLDELKAYKLAPEIAPAHLLIRNR